MSVHLRNLAVLERFNPVRPDGSQGIFASTGPRYAGASFGRDSIEVAEDLVEFDDVIPHEVLLKMASLQGLSYNPITEEEPGKIHHLHRFLADMSSAETRDLYQADSQRWGGDENEMIYYGTVDATPLFVRLASWHIETHGDKISNELIIGRDGQLRSFDEHLKMAVHWILDKIDSSETGLIEFLHTNPKGEVIQTWKDSIHAYVHLDGTPVNYNQPIAPLEVQGYAYDALKNAEKLFPSLIPKGLVQELGRRVVEMFWLEEEQMFAQALDRDESGKLRLVRTPTSNSGLILDSDLLKDIPGTEHMVDKTIEMLLGPDFLTRAGIRCRSLRHAHLVEYPDYHGSFAVWFKETSDFIRGLERFGRVVEAKKLARDLISTIQEMGEYLEYVFVDEHGNLVPVVINDRGRVSLSLPKGSRFADKRCHVPEPGQAWTISAFVRALRLIDKYSRNKIPLTPIPAAKHQSG